MLQITSAHPDDVQSIKRKWCCRDFLGASHERNVREHSCPNYCQLGWSELKSLFGEWWHRVCSRYELESLSERDLADMGMTRIDAFNEIQKPFWQK